LEAPERPVIPFIRGMDGQGRRGSLSRDLIALISSTLKAMPGAWKAKVAVR
jgi:hypothetical protein